MYKLLIADDDEIICRGLGTCIPWEEIGVTVGGMVYDGEKALEYVEAERPDIIIADINMPFMDGMEFSYRVRQRFPDIKIILLTAYKEFEYAQKAVQMQVFEYLTKPFSNQEVQDTVKRAADILEEEKRYRKKVNKNLALIREQRLAELTMYGAEDEEAEQILDGSSSFYQVGILYLRRILETEQDAAIENEVALRMAADKVRALCQGQEGWNLFVQNGRIVLVFEYLEKPSKEQSRLWILRVMESLGAEDNLFLACGVGRIYHGAEKLPESYREAVYAIEQRYGYGNGSIIFYKELPRRAEEYEIALPSIRKFMQERVQQRQTHEIRQEIDRLFEEIKSTRRWNPSALNFMFVEVLHYSYEAAENLELYEGFLKKSGHMLAEMMKTESLEELQTVVEKCFSELLVYLENQNTTDIERRVNQAVSYMKKNYQNPELSLREIADAVHLSASYLGNSIKKYKSISYISLLNQIRIEEAKKLLMRADVKTFEVAFLVGFNSSQYFSSCFKKSTGMTPSLFQERRKEHR